MKYDMSSSQRVSRVFKDIRKVAVLVAVPLILIGFQNCGNFTSMLDGGSSSSSSGSSAAILEGSDSQIRLTDQHYVASTLANIYGLDQNSNPILMNLIVNQPVLFGGPCDTYLGDCTDLSLTQLGPVPGMNSARGALLTRACDLINSVDTNVTTAVNNLGTSGTYNSGTAPTAAGLSAAYLAFHPGRTVGQPAVDALQTVVAAAVANNYGPIEQWRFSLLTLCLAPDWQAP